MFGWMFTTVFGKQANYAPIFKKWS